MPDMEGYPASLRCDGEASLREGFGDFLVRLASKLGASPEAATAAGAAGRACLQALGDGHVCTDLHVLSGILKTAPGEAQALLVDSRVVSGDDEEKKLPLVLDHRGRIYLYRYFAYERQLAADLLARVTAPVPAPLGEEVQRFLAERFAANADRLAGRPDLQRTAVTMALTGPLTIISGGPGTGKTTIVATLIAALALNEPPPRIALAAPTGKAAARLEAALAAQAARLDPEILPRLPDRAMTLHRLLGASREGGKFLYHRDHPLPYDVIVVDEASMLDLSLAARLFSALPPDARIVLLGDKDQLAAVEAGAFFAELARQTALSSCRNPASLPERGNGNLSRCVVWLTENYRFDAASAIGRLSALVSGGDVDGLAAWLPELADGDIVWKPTGKGLPSETADSLAAGFADYVEAVGRGDPLPALTAYEDFCVLCALRQGPRGVAGINEAVERRLRPRLSGKPRTPSPWYHGRPVMVTENAYDLGIFNGDTGVTLAGKDGRLAVWFKGRDGGVRSLSPSALPAHQTSFAVTVHKAQGAEFTRTAFVLPEDDTPVLTRELIYTAVTRARKHLFIYGDMALLLTAVSRPTDRRSGLADRLALSSPEGRAPSSVHGELKEIK